MTFEQGFNDTERSAAAAAKSVASLASAAKDFKKAAATGDIAKLRKVSERISTVLDMVRQDVANARQTWPYTPEEEERYLRESFAAELIEAGKTEGIDIQQLDEGLVAFPSVLRILPSERAVRINRKKVSGVRPSQVARMLAAIRARKAKAAPEQFLEVLYKAYRLLVGKEKGKTVTLASIYEALTILPGSSATYDHTDFVRDLFLLDRSGVSKTRSGEGYSLPASTGTKGGKAAFSFIAPNGETVTYYGIRFSEATS